MADLVNALKGKQNDQVTSERVQQIYDINCFDRNATKHTQKTK